MLKVTLVNLSPDGRIADLAFGTETLGSISEAQFTLLLHTFRDLDPLQNSELEPEILVESRDGKFIIRTGQSKLFLYDARDSAKPYSELSPTEIAGQFYGSAAEHSSEEHQPESPTAPNTPRTPHRGIAISMLAAGLCLNGYTLYSVFYINDVNKKPAVTLITNATELASRQNAAVGRYATGNEPGDRVIVLNPDGTVKFSEIAATNKRTESTDTYRIGHYEDKLCATTPESGIIDITGLNTLVYYRDVYRRTK